MADDAIKAELLPQGIVLDVLGLDSAQAGVRQPVATITANTDDFIRILSAGAGSYGVPAATPAQALDRAETRYPLVPASIVGLLGKGSDIVSAATIAFPNNGNFFHVTGVAPISDIDYLVGSSVDVGGRPVWVVFDAALTLVNSATLILPTGANIVTAAGDSALVVLEGGDTVRCLAYYRKDGTALVGSATGGSPNGGNVASAATVNLGAGVHFHVTGTTTVTAIAYTADVVGRRATLVFDGALILTNSANLLLTTGANISTQAGDTMEIVSEGSGVMRAVDYTRKDGTALVGGGGGSFTVASVTEVLTGTDNVKGVTPLGLAGLWEKGADIASAGTISIGAGGFFHVTGVASISDIDWGVDKTGRGVWLVFDAAATLVNSATLICPGAQSILTAAGDACYVVSEGSDIARILEYRYNSGAYTPVTPSAGNIAINGAAVRPNVSVTITANSDFNSLTNLVTGREYLVEVTATGGPWTVAASGADRRYNFGGANVSIPSGKGALFVVKSNGTQKAVVFSGFLD
jgi:hypothetical protein